VMFESSGGSGSSIDDGGGSGSSSSGSRSNGQHGNGHSMSSSDFDDSKFADGAADLPQAEAHVATQPLNTGGASSACEPSTAIDRVTPACGQVPPATQPLLTTDSNSSLVSADGALHQHCESSGTAVVRLNAQDQGVAPGQYAVFYDGDICLGSAVIQEALSLPDDECQR
jgi:tRNA methyl transferase